MSVHTAHSQDHSPPMALPQCQDPHQILENMTATEHHAISDTILTLLHTDPDDLLQQHQYLLHQQDFHQLGSGSTLDSQHWIAHMNSALAAAKHTGHKRTQEVYDALPHNKRPSP